VKRDMKKLGAVLLLAGLAFAFVFATVAHAGFAWGD
jgi:hypothetical protein